MDRVPLDSLEKEGYRPQDVREKQKQHLGLEELVRMLLVHESE